MPGTSLWLLPPPTHPLYPALQTLISRTLPAAFPTETAALSPHFFAPHITLTSGIAPEVYGADPQAWLDSLPLESCVGKVRVRFTGVASQDVFVRRCFIRVAASDEGVRQLAVLARAHGVYAGDEKKAREWLGEWERRCGPHVSLVYGSMPMDEDKQQEVVRIVTEAGITLSEEKRDRVQKEEEDEEANDESWNGWDGGVLWLVQTDEPTAEWTPIVTRQL
ncbi:2',3'-cyclic-nucleotide 3'-phosphodiesterase [Podospora didyma]|uniref:2',3'-cyclic-nucleotide 3'-phosphodiesterase n=1 Tax=Podospora didyma TaxID=330526 RepID=A0AAE0TWC2_9PEZI|nr:2',3'-cyclic-nucleotide 3'-phosphodiesterase [Podospora didyma]